MDQSLDTIVCPYCGNVNPFTQEYCIKCKKSLGPIRDAMSNAIGQEHQEEIHEPVKEIEPAPPLPELPATTNRESLGLFLGSRVILIRSMGNRAEEIAARFFKQLSDRNIEGLTLGHGSLTIKLDANKEDRRDYYFAEKELGAEAASIMAIRIAPSGTDLYVEWRNYAIPPLGAFHWGYFLGLSLLVFILSIPIGNSVQVPAIICGLDVAIFIALIFFAKGKARKLSLVGFQSQDNQAFQLSVRAALEEAIDHAGISKSFIQEVSKEGNKDQRVI